MTDMEHLIAQLDRDCPNWFTEWAAQRDLADLARGESREGLKIRVLQRLWPMLNAALSAGLVTLPPK